MQINNKIKNKKERATPPGSVIMDREKPRALARGMSMISNE